MRPVEKAKEIDEFLESVSGYNRVESIQKNICSFCGGPAEQFKNPKSIKEYTISGMCQMCQDKVWK